ncbi:hypothetical protein GCM10010191_14180 [Actinomadura vinacea]|uniref:ATP-binding protein n=1 Tax=Actinomadura vinacea TaxID=115336 RepID=A0ABN3ILY0_9ACTN
MGGRGGASAAAGQVRFRPAGSIPSDSGTPIPVPDGSLPRDVRVRRLTVLSGPSGAGRRTVVAEIRRAHQR